MMIGCRLAGTPAGQKRKLEAAAEQAAQTTGKKKSKKSKK
jgi:hypothetical protein